MFHQLPPLPSAFPSDDDLIQLAVQHDRETRLLSTSQRWESQSGFIVSVEDKPIAWVKYNYSCVRSEVSTQEFVREKLAHLSDRIRVPGVYFMLKGYADGANHSDDADATDASRKPRPPPYMLIVMEYVQGRTVRNWLKGETSETRIHLFWDRVVEAQAAILSIEPDEKDMPAPGMVSGDRIEHMLFGEYAEPGDAPRDFESVKELEDHINQTIESSLGRFRYYSSQIGKSDARVDFSQEPFRLCFCDSHQSNFMLSDSEAAGPIYIIDFYHCMWLPVSFLSWALKKNFRDAIFGYLLKKLEEQHLLPELGDNYKALEEFHARQ